LTSAEERQLSSAGPGRRLFEPQPLKAAQHDAIHLAAATSVRAGLSAFVTYDKRLAAAAGEAGLPALSPA
jgi:hypothetical protein